MALQRVHILLEPGQHRLLSDIARREGRSVSEVTREIVQQGIQQRQQDYKLIQDRRLTALKNAQRVRKAILEERGAKLLEIDVVKLIHEMREERDDRILGNRD